MRSEEDQNKLKLREKYKKDKEKMKSMISEKKSFEEEQGKRRYQKIKNQELDLYGKKKKIEDMILMRSRQNYLRKMQQQMVII